jgi:LPXTG-motif cell wall-anchored protein
MYLRSENVTSGAPTNPVGAYKGGLSLGGCCAKCNSGAVSCGGALGESSTSVNILGLAALAGVAWFVFRKKR